MEAISANILPRYTKRKGDNKVKQTVDDIFDILALADEYKLLDKLPRYAAVDLDRIPTVCTDDLEIFSIACRLKTIDERLASIETIAVCDPQLNHRLTNIED